MKLLKQVGPKHDDKGHAQDALAGIAVVPGFVFGYVDEKENRCVSFHRVSDLGGELQRGQQVVDVVFGPVPEYDHEATTETLKPVVDAIFGTKAGASVTRM